MLLPTPTVGLAVKSVAVMQPYFVPYAGYFRLFEAANTFVVLDSVQFPRRGWVHRNRLTDYTGELAWLNLPLVRGPQQMLIQDLEFPGDVRERLTAQLRRFPTLSRLNAAGHPLVERLTDFSGSPVDYLVRLLRECCSALGLPFDIVRSSELGGLDQLRRHELLIGITKQLNAGEYVNLSGGAALYDAGDFESRGIQLRILPHFRGSNESILGRLLSEPTHAIRDEILANA